MASAYFSRATFAFLKELKAHNDRDWFAANKGRYEEHVKAPALRLIEAFGPELHRISPRFTSTPRSLFRIHRDVRFSKDKSPFKTSVGIHFRHEAAKDAHAPGFYLHVEPGRVFAGCGIWHPDSATARSIREHIVAEPDAWKKATRGKGFRDGLELVGDRLKRPPRGFDAEHPLADDLLWKDFMATTERPQSFVTSDSAPRDLARAFAPGAPLVRFLCDAVGVAF